MNVKSSITRCSKLYILIISILVPLFVACTMYLHFYKYFTITKYVLAENMKQDIYEKIKKKKINSI